MQVGDVLAIDVEGLDVLIGVLGELGYDTRGPVVRDGAIVPGHLAGAGDLPAGYHDDQAPGHYRLEQGDDQALFGWAVGPGSWKAELFPPSQELWRAGVEGDDASVTEPGPPRAALAIVGARPCELAALDVLDRVLVRGVITDPRYASRRIGAFVVVVECGAPASTCFCTSMGAGPDAGGGYDLALTEIFERAGHRFVVRVGTARGGEVLESVPVVPVGASALQARRQVLAGTEAAIDRRLDTEGLAELLARNLEHPRWSEVAGRCLACGNCTLVCPTCFCSDVHDITDLEGEVRRERSWTSCFDLDHSYLYGGPVRSSVSSRYRQWLTHKLSTWWDQFDTSGCVGCGRCIVWCPVGIDLTEEAAAIRCSGGAASTSAKAPRRSW